jgi:hypothetical protein
MKRKKEVQTQEDEGLRRLVMSTQNWLPAFFSPSIPSIPCFPFSLSCFLLFSKARKATARDFDQSAQRMGQ